MSDPIHIDDVTPSIIGQKMREHLAEVSALLAASNADPTASKQALIDLSFWCGMAHGEMLRARRDDPTPSTKAPPYYPPGCR